MCCSIRAAVFFLASVHIFFSVAQLVLILPIAVGDLGEKLVEASMGLLFCVLFFATGFMTFRGADEESATLVRLGAFCLAFVIIFRFVLLSFKLMLVEKLPEAAFLYVYGTSVIPVGFTCILYLVYLAILFCYYKELKYEGTTTTSIGGGGHGHGGTRSNLHRSLSSQQPFTFQSPTPILRPHILSSNSNTLTTTCATISTP